LCTSQLGTTKTGSARKVGRLSSARASVPARSQAAVWERCAVRSATADLQRLTGATRSPATTRRGGLGGPPRQEPLAGVSVGTGTPLRGSSCRTRTTSRPNRVRVRLFRKGALSVPDLGRACAGYVLKAGARSKAPGGDPPQHAVTKGDVALLSGGTGGTVDRLVGSRLPSTVIVDCVPYVANVSTGTRDGFRVVGHANA
jgi:hypothetical protein